VTGRGVKICKHVPEEVQDAARAAIDGPPEKKLKTVAGSSNNEVTNAISASAQEQNNEVMAQQGDALSLEALEDWIASFTVEEIDRKNAGSTSQHHPCAPCPGVSLARSICKAFK
jgi:hypothetical protein